MDKRHHVSERRARSRSKAEVQDRRDPQRLVNEDRAAELLGLTARDLRRLSGETGLGHVETNRVRNGSSLRMRSFTVCAAPLCWLPTDFLSEFHPAPQRPNAPRPRVPIPPAEPGAVFLCSDRSSRTAVVTAQPAGSASHFCLTRWSPVPQTKAAPTHSNHESETRAAHAPGE